MRRVLHDRYSLCEGLPLVRVVVMRRNRPIRERVGVTWPRLYKAGAVDGHAIASLACLHRWSAELHRCSQLTSLLFTEKKTKPIQNGERFDHSTLYVPKLLRESRKIDQFVASGGRGRLTVAAILIFAGRFFQRPFFFIIRFNPLGSLTITSFSDGILLFGNRFFR